MDGYAVRLADLPADGSQVTLQVTGDVAAGPSGLTEVGTGQAVRIMTGAPLPPGADAVIPVERTSTVLCDLTVAAEHARFGQSGPRVGSFDAGFGSAYLARVVGEKRARQIWFLLDLYDAQTAERWNLVNEVVPADQLMDKAREYARTIGAYSPTALKFLKHSFNADSEHLAGISNVAFDGLDLFVHTDEGMEGATAFAEKRAPDFSPYR
jgi:1,4-dihydroxy-2-naphthoyl-CoA synthase